MSYTVKCVVEQVSELGECPVWSVREQALYWADILGRQLHRFDPLTGAVASIVLPEEIGCYGLRRQGGFIVALRSGIYLLSEDGTLGKKLADNPCNPADSRFNDGRVDPWGRFWAGTIWQPRDRNGAVLMRIDEHLRAEVMAADVMVSNGLAFSPDRAWMYHSDTPNHVLYRYALDADGDPGARQMVRTFNRGSGGRPDGAAFDSQGCYWSAQFDGGRILRLAQDGTQLDEIRVPTRWPTMVAFGGPDLRTLYITSSRENRSAEELAEWPLSGCVFAVEVNVPGNPEPTFAG
ncbi:6-deoxy-6-sulfogluconolactonase [Serratia sp. UGAL515B_01]|uniref:6-deoxy-6-sulfogluconolactonase n=1 Tax=Serratia sp. UGAL515B_01 TaxID=2986763 RepID=UPI0029539AE8|nr:6-deoxy-6-sulfogluconolactonase [Serratia sp. UGAL515B_01]WON77745.1 SMP-30/gluconolactonase/LRE family protein [Serratia sp. UGAL515B_01]